MEQNNKNKHVLAFLKPENILLKIRNIKLNQDTLVFLIFLVISTTFWFLNALRENYGDTFTIPVKYVNVADNESIISKSDETIKLRVRGGGYAILRQKISKTFSAISIDISRLNRSDTGNESHAYLLPRMQRDNIQEQLFIGLELESIEPDTLFINLAKIAKKKVAIIPNGEVIPEKQFILAGKIIFSPDSVEIIAPVNVIAPSSTSVIVTPPFTNGLYVVPYSICNVAGAVITGILFPVTVTAIVAVEVPP